MALGDCANALVLDPWIDDDDLGPCASVGTIEQRARAIAVATELLYVASGRRFACHVDTIRPTSTGAGCGCNMTLVDRALAIREGTWCGCAGGAGIVLPGPVSAIVAVTIDGVVLDESAYALFDNRRLVRVDGLGWPCCQSLTTPDGDVGSWSVEYRHGTQPPVSGVSAAIELACETARFLAGDTNCRLPRRLQTVTRQNVTVALVDSQDFLDKGRIGLPLADYFLTYFGAPSRTGRRARIASPDTIRRSTAPDVPAP